MNRPDPVVSNAPDDKPVLEKWKFWFVGTSSSSSTTVTAWCEEDSEAEEGFLFAWANKDGTVPCVVNLNHVYYASQVD